MARGGVNKAIVLKAREALLARGMNPSIDAVRVELGNTGSKTTIHRYLKEIEAFDPRPESARAQLSDELSELVSGLLERILEEGNEAIEYAKASFDRQRSELESRLAEAQSEVIALQRQFDSQQVALKAQTAELQLTQTSLQSEITRNARLGQSCQDLEMRVTEKDEQIRSLEEKHLHARDALEHYRNAVKEQREQERQRHEGQLQQVQVELRQLQQMQAIKQEELTRLNRDNERLLSESRHQTKKIVSQEDSIQRLAAEISSLKITIAKADGAKELLQEQIATLRAEAKLLTETTVLAEEKATEARALLEASSAELLQVRQALSEAEENSGSIRAMAAAAEAGKRGTDFFPGDGD